VGVNEMNVRIERQRINVSIAAWVLSKMNGKEKEYLRLVTQGTGLSEIESDVYANIANGIGIVNIDGMKYHNSVFVVS
jgi:hypothetical protein